AEKGKISCMPGPHPVVCIFSKITDRRGRGAHQPYIPVCLRYKKAILVSFKKSPDKAILVVFLFYRLAVFIYVFINAGLSFALCQLRCYSLQNGLCHIFYSYNEGDK